jgi:glycerol-3-phosphate dehydrogenase
MVARLKAETFDLAVIGGGINGAATARDAAMRGLKVALIEKGDFAGATSSRSSKLIHGGLRYLPQGQLRLVYQALRERERLRHLTAPHLVGPIRFLLPFFSGRRPGRFMLSLGLTLYDLMAWTPRAKRHQRLSPKNLHALEPCLRRDGVSGGASYYDCSGDDARLTLENMLDGAYCGAAVVNYVAVESFARDGAMSVLAVRDLENGAAIALRARQVVNAAGPWVDELRRMDTCDAAPSVRLTKGVHLIVARERLPIQNALVLTDHGGRIVFLMPHGRCVLIGTTDSDFAGDPARVNVEADDVTYLLSVIGDAMPSIELAAADVLHAFAGLRALPLGAPGARPSAVPRDEVILESPSGMITVAGGKLTTHRAIAEEVVDRLGPRLGSVGRCTTRDTPLPGARATAAGDTHLTRLPQAIRELLAARYGTRAESVARIADQRNELAEPIAPGAPAIGAEVVFAVRYELARTVSDFLVRRTAMAWRAPHEARVAAPAVARLMAAALGWTPARERLECNAFRDPESGSFH